MALYLVIVFNFPPDKQTQTVKNEQSLNTTFSEGRKNTKMAKASHGLFNTKMSCEELRKLLNIRTFLMLPCCHAASSTI